METGKEPSPAVTGSTLSLSLSSASASASAGSGNWKLCFCFTNIGRDFDVVVVVAGISVTFGVARGDGIIMTELEFIIQSSLLYFDLLSEFLNNFAYVNYTDVGIGCVILSCSQ